MTLIIPRNQVKSAREIEQSGDRYALDQYGLLERDISRVFDLSTPMIRLLDSDKPWGSLPESVAVDYRASIRVPRSLKFVLGSPSPDQAMPYLRRGSDTVVAVDEELLLPGDQCLLLDSMVIHIARDQLEDGKPWKTFEATTPGANYYVEMTDAEQAAWSIGLDPDYVPGAVTD